MENMDVKNIKLLGVQNVTNLCAKIALNCIITNVILGNDDDDDDDDDDIGAGHVFWAVFQGLVGTVRGWWCGF